MVPEKGGVTSLTQDADNYLDNFFNFARFQSPGPIQQDTSVRSEYAVWPDVAFPLKAARLEISVI